MQVICTDGTRFACESYDLTEYGIVLYDQPKDPDGERYDSDPAQIGYVPHDRLWYILPEGVTPKVPGVAGLQNRARGVQPRGSQGSMGSHPPANQVSQR